MKRKSPVRHKVRTHIREGKPVKSYQRGKGSRKVNPRRSKVVGRVPRVDHDQKVTREPVKSRTQIIKGTSLKRLPSLDVPNLSDLDEELKKLGDEYYRTKDRTKIIYLSLDDQKRLFEYIESGSWMEREKRNATIRRIVKSDGVMMNFEALMTSGLWHMFMFYLPEADERLHKSVKAGAGHFIFIAEKPPSFWSTPVSAVILHEMNHIKFDTLPDDEKHALRTMVKEHRYFKRITKQLRDHPAYSGETDDVLAEEYLVMWASDPARARVELRYVPTKSIWEAMEGRVYISD